MEIWKCLFFAVFQTVNPEIYSVAVHEHVSKHVLFRLIAGKKVDVHIFFSKETTYFSDSRHAKINQYWNFSIKILYHFNKIQINQINVNKQIINQLFTKKKPSSHVHVFSYSKVI